MDFTALNLRYNPFECQTPYCSNEHLLWFGMEDQKQSIVSSYQKIIDSPSSIVVLNWGQPGIGKTQAAFYFSSKIEDELNNSKAKFYSAYARIPRNGENMSKNIVKNIFDFFSLRDIKKELGNINSDKIQEYLQAKGYDEDLIATLIHLNKCPLNVFQRFVYNGLSLTELTTWNLKYNLKSNDDYTTLLAAIINAMTYTNPQKRFILWFDELENITHYNNLQFKLLSRFLEDLIEKVDKKLLIFLNFSLSDNSLDLVRLLIGDSLFLQIDKKIRFEICSLNEAIVYCKSTINYAQIDNNLVSPFTNDAIKAILKRISEVDLTPRKINIIFDDFIKAAMSLDIDIIDEKFVLDSFQLKNHVCI